MNIYPFYVSRELKKYIQSASFEACRNAGILSQCDDMEQECIIVLDRIQPLVDANREGSVAFQKKAVKFKILDFLKSGRRFKNAQLVYSLDEKIAKCGDSVAGTKIDLIGGRDLDYERKRDLAIDVAEVIARLPKKHIEACLCLLLEMDKQDIPAAIGVTEYRFRKVMVPALRKAFRYLWDEI